MNFIILLIFATTSVSEINANILGGLVDRQANCSRFSVPNVAFLPPDVEDFIRILKSQPYSSELLEEILASEAKVLADIAKHQNSSVIKYKHAPIEDLVEKDGYTLETHKVTTEDGYILTLHRIPNENRKAKPIFLLHGNLASSVSWLTVSQENVIPYFLVSQGYDVWMGNVRGNKYSKKHVSISPKCAEFWDFSFHEIGIYDVPVMVDYVLTKTNKKTLTYIGHSQGTISVLVLLSELPEYNEKFDNVIFLAGFSSLGHIKSPIIRAAAENQGFLYTLTSLLGVHEIPSEKSSPVMTLFINLIQETICGNSKLSKLICSNILFLLFGFGHANLDIENLPIILGHIPTSTSGKTLAHFAQLAKTGKFRQFDYGEDKNMEVYNQEIPPEYNTANIEPPFHLFYSNSDWTITPPDINKLTDQLFNVSNLTVHFIPNYSHIDWIWSKNLKRDVHPILKSLLN